MEVRYEGDPSTSDKRRRTVVTSKQDFSIIETNSTDSLNDVSSIISPPEKPHNRSGSYMEELPQFVSTPGTQYIESPLVGKTRVIDIMDVEPINSGGSSDSSSDSESDDSVPKYELSEDMEHIIKGKDARILFLMEEIKAIKS
eukprot:UN23649